MYRWVQLALRLSATCLFLGLAWLHLFWESPYLARMDQLPEDLAFNPDIVAKSVGGFFLLAGLVMVAWRPRWLVWGVLFVAIVPTGLWVYCQAPAGKVPLASMLGNLLLVFTPWLLLFGMLG